MNLNSYEIRRLNMKSSFSIEFSLAVLTLLLNKVMPQYWYTIFASLESLSMTFTADGKRQRLPLIFYSFLVILN